MRSRHGLLRIDRILAIPEGRYQPPLVLRLFETVTPASLDRNRQILLHFRLQLNRRPKSARRARWRVIQWLRYTTRSYKR
jgi:hypothetical protein